MADRTNLFMVEQRHDRDRIVAIDPGERGECRMARQLIVEPRCTDEFCVEADQRARGDVVEHQVAAEDVRRSSPGSLSDHARDSFVAQAIDRGEVSLLVEQKSLLGDLSVEVNRELRDAQNRFVYENQLLGCVARAVSHQYPARHAQVSVQP